MVSKNNRLQVVQHWEIPQSEADTVGEHPRLLHRHRGHDARLRHWPLASWYWRGNGWAPPGESIDPISEVPEPALKLEGELSITVALALVLKDTMNSKEEES